MEPKNKKKKNKTPKCFVVRLNFEGDLDVESNMLLSDLEEVLERELFKQKVHFLSQIVPLLDDPFDLY
jgi:hypothetical protein